MNELISEGKFHGDQLLLMLLLLGLTVLTVFDKVGGVSLATDRNLVFEYFLCTTVKLPVPALLWKATIIVAHSL